MAYVVTAKISVHGGRSTSQKFATRREADMFARRTKADRPGSNPRVKKVN